MSDFSISAIIPTKNRPDDMRLTLKTLLSQSVPVTELIVIDQSEDNRTRVVASEEFDRATKQGIPVPALRYIHDTSIAGVSQARNRALDIAGCDIWLFLDDDVDIEPVFVEELVKAFKANPEVGGISGVITNYPVPPISYRNWLWLFARGPFREKRLPVYWDAHKYRTLVPVIGMSGGLMSFRADIARSGRFDESMRDGEDVDYCVNLRAAPLMVLAPRARLKHMASNINRVREAWLKKFAASQSHLYHKNWKNKLGNRICFGWFVIGVSLASLLSCVRRFSLEPFLGMLQGLRQGEAAAAASRSQASGLAKPPVN